MDLSYLSPIINILLIVAFIVDRLYRLRSIKEYKEAKEAQIDNLKQQLEIERKNNDIEITEMHKKRYENLKVILDEKSEELEKSKNALLELQSTLENASKEIDFKVRLNETLQKELKRVEENKRDLENEKERLLKIINNPANTYSKGLGSFLAKKAFNIIDEYNKLEELKEEPNIDGVKIYKSMIKNKT